MPVLYKSTIDAARKELETYYQQLLAALDCRELSNVEACAYTSDPKNMPVVGLNADDLLDAIGHFKVCAESLKRLKSKAIKPSSQPLFDPQQF